MSLINHNTVLEDSADAYSFSQWQMKQQQKADDSAFRKQKTELYALVRRVIKNELSDTQQLIVRLRWYEGKNIDEIAEITGLERSTVSRKEKRINDIIFDKLKYAMEYRYGKTFSQSASDIIRSNRVACCPVKEKSISERLRNLRLRNDFTVKDIAGITGIRESRINFIEAEGDQINIGELSKLSQLYSTTTDYIIFGTEAKNTEGVV